MSSILSQDFHGLAAIRGFCFRSKENPFHVNSVAFWNIFGTLRWKTSTGQTRFIHDGREDLSFTSLHFGLPSTGPPSATSNTCQKASSLAAGESPALVLFIINSIRDRATSRAKL